MMETTQRYTNRWAGKQNVAYYNVISLSREEKEVRAPATTRVTLESIAPSERSQTGTKGHWLQDSIYVKYPDQANPPRQKADSRLSEAGGGEKKE